MDNLFFFRQKSETVRKMAIVRAPGYFLHRKEIYGGSENVGCFSQFYPLLVIKHSIPLKWNILLPIISIRSDWSPFPFVSFL
jgi:hypothetical protein